MTTHFNNPHFKMTAVFDDYRHKLAMFCVKNNYLFLDKSHVEMNTDIKDIYKKLINEEMMDNLFHINESESQPMIVTICPKKVCETGIYLGLEESDDPNTTIYNSEVLIEYNDSFLTACYVKNKVYLSYNNTHQWNQRWFIEKDPNLKDIVYIRTALTRYNHSHYLGSPNKNNQVFMYSSKNEFTQWKLVSTQNSDTYHLQYVGEKFNPKEVQIVLSRYNECVDWAVPYMDIVVLYDKCDMQTRQIPEFTNYIKMENVGREGHTYLNHIINNYDNLPERIFFLQAFSFDHNMTLLYGIDNFRKNTEVQPLGLIYEDYLDHQHPPTPIVEKYKTVTSYGLEYCVVNINGNLQCISYSDTGMDGVNTKYKKQYPIQANMGLTVVDAFLERATLNLHKPTNDIRFTFSALFSVSRNAILRNGVDIYIKLRGELIALDKQAGINGYILERLWLYILEK
jgi:hypothetical protein